MPHARLQLAHSIILGMRRLPGIGLLAVHPQSSWVCCNVFLIDLCMLGTDLKVLSGANE